MREKATVAPLRTCAGDSAFRSDHGIWLLYPFVDAPSGFTTPLSKSQWTALGACVRAVHDAALPGRLVDSLRHEDYAPRWRDAARAIVQLVAANASGIVHAANSGDCTWFEFAKTALELCQLTAPVEAVPSAQFPTPARRAKNSALASARLQPEFKIAMPHWRDALRTYLGEKGHLPS